MKLATKLIIFVSISMLVVSSISNFMFYSKSKTGLINSHKEISLAVIETFALTLNGSETAESLQKYLLKLQETIPEIEEFNIYQLGTDSKAIASTDPKTIGKPADPEDLKAANSDLVIPVVDGDTIDITTGLRVNGQVKYVAGVKFSMVSEVARLNHLILINALTMLGLTIIVVGILWFIIAYFLTGSLKSLVQLSERISTGDLRLTQGEMVNHKKDEIGILSRSFYHMIINLRNLVEKISLSSSQIEKNATQFLLVSAKTGKSSQSISVDIESISQGSKNQLISISESSVVINEVAKGVQQIAMSTEDVSSSSSSSLRKAENGKQIIDETKLIIENLVIQSKESVAKIELLGEKTKEIDQIIITISQISEQTNLLSLNASIEAARAGEQGRGFAVVASEVKKLAEQSRIASDSVSKMINSIQEDTVAVVLQISNSYEQTENGLVAVRRAGESFDQIAIEVDTVNGQLMNVSAVVEEMSASSEEIAATIQSLVNNVEKASEKAEHVSAASVESMASMQELVTSSENLTQLSTELNNLISNFKL
jgi:methyl-accepting chemotaxis protein